MSIDIPKRLTPRSYFDDDVYPGDHSGDKIDDELDIEMDNIENHMAMWLDDIFVCELDDYDSQFIHSKISKKYNPVEPITYCAYVEEFLLKTQKKFTIVTKNMIIDNIFASSIRSAAQSFYIHTIPENYPIFAIKDLKNEYYFFILKLKKRGRNPFQTTVPKKIPEFSFKRVHLSIEMVQDILTNIR